MINTYTRTIELNSIIEPIPNHNSYCKIKRGTKEPIGTNWQHNTNTFSEIETGLNNGEYGFGIVYGEKLSGIDIDNTQARDRFKKHFGMYPHEFVQKNNIISWTSGKNFKGVWQPEINEQSCLTILFANTPEDWELLKGRRTAKNNTFDIRTGLCQSVLPSYSLHPQTKHPYRWICPSDGAKPATWGDILPNLLAEIDEENFETGKLSPSELKDVLEHKTLRYDAWRLANEQGLSFNLSPNEFMEFVVEPQLTPLQLFDDERHNFNKYAYHGSNKHKGNPFYRQSSSGKSFILFQKPSLMGMRWFFNDTADEDLKGNALYYRHRIVLGNEGYPDIDEQWKIVEYYAKKANIKLPAKRHRKEKLGIILVNSTYELEIVPKPTKALRVAYQGEEIVKMSDHDLSRLIDDGFLNFTVDNHEQFNSIAQRLFRLGINDIVDASETGSGKTHRTANTNPQDFDVEFLRYISPVFHLNPTSDMTKWDAEISRHGGTALTKKGKKFRTKHNAPYKIEGSNCIRSGAMQHFQNLGTPIPMDMREDKDGNPKLRSALCTGCPQLESCSYLSQKVNSFKYKRSRIHPNSLINNSQDEPKDGYFHPSKAVAIVDEVETLELAITDNYSLKQLDRAISELRRHEFRKNIEPIPYDIISFLTELSLYLDDEKIGKYGISNNNDLFKIELPEYDTELLRNYVDNYRKLLGELPDLLDIEDIDDKLEKENKIAENIKNHPRLSNIFYNFIPDLLDILSGKIQGAICISNGEIGRHLTITKPNDRLINNIKAFKHRIYLDATVNVKYLAQTLKTNEKDIVTMKIKPKKGADLEIVQIFGVGRMTKERSDTQEKNKEAIIKKIQSIHRKDNVGIIDYKKFADNDDSARAWVTDSRGSNDFSKKEALVIVGLLCTNLNVLVNEFKCLTGKIPEDKGKIVEYLINATNLDDGIEAIWRGYETEDEELRDFIRHKVLAEAHQAIGRLRANRREGEDLKVYILCDYPLDLPVTLISAGEFCPEAMNKREAKATKIFDAILDIHHNIPFGLKLTQDMIAEKVGIPKSTISDYINDLLMKNLPPWINRKYDNVKDLICGRYKHLYRGVIPTAKSTEELKILRESVETKNMTIIMNFDNLKQEVLGKWLKCTNKHELLAVDDDYKDFANWKEERNLIWKSLTKSQKNQIKSLSGINNNDTTQIFEQEKGQSFTDKTQELFTVINVPNSNHLPELYSADEARRAVFIGKDRVECDENKLDIFSSTKITFPEYKPSNNLQPYEEVRKLYLDTETLGLDGKTDRVILIGIKDEKHNYHIFWDINEKIMIQKALDFIKEYKPQMLVGYNIINFDIPFLINRCNHHNIQPIFKVGTKETKCASAFVFGKPVFYRPIYMDNCSVVDTYHLVLQYDNVARKLSKYDLKTATVEMELRADRRLELNHKEIANAWDDGNVNIIENYLKFDLDDTELITNQLLPPIYYQKLFLPNIKIQDLIRLGTGTKWQMILDNDYEDRNSPEPDDKLSYEGASTFANYGLFRECGKIDVGSLYPSIMLKYGLCSYKDNHRKLLGVLNYLTNERLRLKALAKQGDKEADYKQGSMKILINSAYGLLGVGGLGYNDMSASALVTAYGRKILKFMLESIESQGGQMVECDTDGIIFSHPNSQEVHLKLQSELPEGINIELEWTANGVYVPSDGNGNGLKKNYIVFKGGYDIKLKGKYRKREISQIEREFPVEYLRLYLINPTQAEDYYKSLKSEILSHNYPIEKLANTRKIKSNEKQLSHLGNQGDIVTFWESDNGKTSTISDGYNAYLYLSKIDEILLGIKQDLNLVINGKTEETKQMSFL